VKFDMQVDDKCYVQNISCKSTVIHSKLKVVTMQTSDKIE
jgi:hypothetical protein